MERALKTVRKRVPSAVTDLDTARDALIKKFESQVITNITDFRMLSKIATSVRNLGVKEIKARQAIRDILDPKTKVGIHEVFAGQFEMRYDERRVTLSIESLSQFLEVSVVQEHVSLNEELVHKLRDLKRLIDRALRS